MLAERRALLVEKWVERNPVATRPSGRGGLAGGGVVRKKFGGF